MAPVELFKLQETPSTDPSLSVSPTSIAFGEKEINGSYQETFTVNYANLNENLTVAGFEGITVSPATIEVGEGTGEATVTVTYAPTAVGSIEGNITVSNTEDEVSQTVAVTGSAYDPPNLPVFQKVTDASQITTDGVYLMVETTKGKANAGAISNNALSTFDVAISDGHVLTSYNEEGKPYTITLEAATDGYYIKINGQYLNNANSTNLALGTTGASVWTFNNKETYGGFLIQNSSNGNRFIGGANSDVETYKAYATSNMSSNPPAILYKLFNANQVAIPTFSVEAGTYTSAQSISISCETEGATIQYKTTENGEWQNYTAAITVSETTTIWAKATKEGMDDSDIATATYTIVIIEHAGTEADPYSVADARNLIDMGEPYPEGVYAAGIVSEIVTAYSEQYGNISYNISTDGTTEADQLQAFRGKSYNGENFTSEDDIQVGDIVVIYGDLTKYNSTYEIAANNQLVSLERPVVPTITVNPTSLIGFTYEQGYGPSEAQMLTVSASNLSTTYMSINTDMNYNVSLDGETYSTYASINAVNGTIESTTVYVRLKDGLEAQNDIEGSITFASTGAQTVTVSLNGSVTAPRPEALYTYSLNGVEGVSMEAHVGDVITLSPAMGVNNDFTFAGWTLDPNDVENLLGETYILEEEETTFYAVYEHTVTVGTPTRDAASYVKVTSTDEITDGDYLIVSSGLNNNEEFNVAFDGSKSTNNTLDATSNKIDVTIDNDTIAYTAEIAASAFTIASMDGGYSIKSASGIYIGRTASSNGMNMNTEDAIANAISFDTEGNALITGTGDNSAAKLQYNSAKNTWRFRYYTSTQKAIQLYKYTEGGVPTPTPVATTARYTRVFLNQAVSDNITIVGPSIIPANSMLDMGANTLTNEKGASKFVIEDGAQYIGNSVNATVQKNIEACTYSNDNNAGYYLIASPIYDNLTAANVNGMLTNYYDLYKFDNTEDLEWRNYKDANFTIDPEVGYLYASGSNTIVEFAGELNEYEELSKVTIPNAGFNLIGNPFACDVYVYDVSSEPMDFQVLNSDGQTFTDGSTAVKVGDAFLVQTTEANQEVYFNHEQFRNAAAVTMSIVKNRGNFIDNARVRFGEGRGMNKFYLNENGTHIFIPQGNEEMAVAYSAAEGEMPVSFKANENGTYTLSVEAENVEMNYLHLIDNMTGADVDLLATPSYSFEARTSDYTSRFRLVFSASQVPEPVEGPSAFAFFNGSSWTVSNMGEATLQVIDMMGRVLSSQAISGNADLNVNQPVGVYMLRLVNGNDVKVQKVVVK